MPVYLESPLGYFICRKSLPEFKSLENQFLTSWVTAGTLTSWVAAGTLTSWVTAGTPLNQTQKDHNKWAKTLIWYKYREFQSRDISVIQLGQLQIYQFLGLVSSIFSTLASL